jgi:hypothetical protein
MDKQAFRQKIENLAITLTYFAVTGSDFDKTLAEFSDTMKQAPSREDWLWAYDKREEALHDD